LTGYIENWVGHESVIVTQRPEYPESRGHASTWDSTQQPNENKQRSS